MNNVNLSCSEIMTFSMKIEWKNDPFCEVININFKEDKICQ